MDLPSSSSLDGPELSADRQDLVPGLVLLAHDDGLLLDELLLGQLPAHQLFNQLGLGRLVLAEGPGNGRC